jgi:sulfatase modifying factor 1
MIIGLLFAAAVMVPLPGGYVDTVDPLTGLSMKVRAGTLLVESTEVTQRDYQRIVGTNPSKHKGDDLPVENVSWWDAIRYCNLRSKAEGLQPAYD